MEINEALEVIAGRSASPLAKINPTAAWLMAGGRGLPPSIAKAQTRTTGAKPNISTGRKARPTADGRLEARRRKVLQTLAAINAENRIVRRSQRQTVVSRTRLETRRRRLQKMQASIDADARCLNRARHFNWLMSDMADLDR